MEEAVRVQVAISRLLGVLGILLLASSCGRDAFSGDGRETIPANVLHEIDAVRDVTRAVHDEYERLYSTVLFPNDTMKTAASRWHRGKEVDWQFIQIIDLRLRRLGLGQSVVDQLFVFDNGNSYIEAEPTVFVETTYYPKFAKKELASLAKLASLREDYDAARLRLGKALLDAEAGRNRSSRP
jgi:hypothetical protein